MKRKNRFWATLNSKKFCEDESLNLKIMKIQTYEQQSDTQAAHRAIDHIKSNKLNPKGLL